MYAQLIDDGVHPESARELAMKEFLYLEAEPASEPRAEQAAHTYPRPRIVPLMPP